MTNQQQRVLYALYNSDLEFVAKELKEMKINSRYFKELCHTAMDSGHQGNLEFLLRAYYQFWDQALFDDLIKFATVNHYYQYLRFIDLFIDNVNDTIKSSKTEEPNKPEMKVEAPKKVSIIDKIKKIIKPSK
jgi:hypothetical protein